MSKKPTHRGVAPEDGELFETRHQPALRAAMQDLCWLLDRDYALQSAVELVGNRYNLTARQRLALKRCACTASAQADRLARQAPVEALRGETLWLDGFNVLLAVEVALSGGVILRGRDGCYRDVAGVHAHYHRVAETEPALRLIAQVTRQLGVVECRWYLDRPVSNSGRLKHLMLDLAETEGWPWQVELVLNPDHVLVHSESLVATADSAVLDRCRRWVNLTGWIIHHYTPKARVVDLSLQV
ncbi:MAG: DUF434 domain-containing protein [Verrucomicrobiae bacterium]|nr:DUF434 domain-containing protein [Verrucomicrobiae bacterium]